MRLFVAIDLDDAARQAMAAEQKRLEQALGGAERSLRWVGPEQIHLTLVFIGEIDEGRSAAIVEAMREEIGAAPFSMTFGHLGMFPPQGEPSVLWVGVTAGAREVIALQRLIADRLEPFGVKREPRPYHPHLTLARWRRSKPNDRRLVLAADAGGELARVAVEAVVLYRSQLSSAGPSHSALVRAVFRGSS